MGERKGTKGLELWCRKMTEGYQGVNVVNMTTSWRDGLAFCAIIHHFRPDLIEFSKLNKDDVYYNNELAFRIAERDLGIPALLEPEDMVEFDVPDRLSILTYLSQFYQTFVVGQGKSPSRIAPKRQATSPERGMVSHSSASPPKKVAFPGAGKVRREPCAKCDLPVFIAERLNVGKLLYHRTCFRCARCNSQLTLANYYETENNEFCCETCPDEEKPIFTAPDSSVLTRSLSDEEKSASLKSRQTSDEYSANFETALEFLNDESLKRNTLRNSQHARARSAFIGGQVDSDSGNEEPPDLPKTKPPSRADDSSSDSGFRNKLTVQSSASVGSSSNRLDESHDVVTKDTISAEGNSSSLVKARMRLFESKSDKSNEIRSVNNKVPLMNLSGQNNNTDIIPDSDLHSFKDNILKEDISEETSAIFDHNVQENLKQEHNADNSVIIISDSSNDDAELQLSNNEILNSSEVSTEEKPNVTGDSIITISDTTTDETNSDILKNNDQKLEDDQENDTTSSAVNPNLEVSLPETVTAPREETSNDLSPKVEESTPEGVAQNRLTPEIVTNNEDDYPEDLNPFSDEETEESNTASVPLNPFDEDEDEAEQDVPASQTPKPAPRKIVKPVSADRDVSLYIQRISVNPFDEDEDTQGKAELSAQPVRKRVIVAPRISLNPFWSDDEEENELEDRPVAKPRISRSSAGAPVPKPRESGLSISSSSTVASSSSSQSTYTLKKKKLAPRPPSLMSGTESATSSLTSSPCHSVGHSPRATPKLRKFKKAPLPPTSTPMDKVASPPSLDLAFEEEYEREKCAKDEQNRNRKSQNLALLSPSSSENSMSLSAAPNKSTYGKWKRRKGQAPTRPVPQRRTIKSLPIVEVRQELDVIEIQQQGLEKQGVRLEQMIRERCEGPHVTPDASLPPEIEEMILQLFELVNEKNELFRRQAELMYLRRQHKLEEEYADTEYQIRCLMLQPEANKTDSDKVREEELISSLVEIVERRNEIVECLEMDRVREAEEDDSINYQLNLYTLKKDDRSAEKMKEERKEKKKHKKEKKSKLKGHKIDADKDIDESEISTVIKDKKKKKFNIF